MFCNFFDESSSFSSLEVNFDFRYNLPSRLRLRKKEVIQFLGDIHKVLYLYSNESQLSCSVQDNLYFINGSLYGMQLSSLEDLKLEEIPCGQVRYIELKTSLTPEIASILKKHFYSVEIINILGVKRPNIHFLETLPKLIFLNIFKSNLVKKDLMSLKNFHNLEEINLGVNLNSDQKTQYLKGLKKLNYLDLEYPQITSLGFSHLKNCKIEDMTIMGSAINHQSKKYLRSVENLYLTLDNSDLFPERLSLLKEFPNIILIGLGGTKITDEGLCHLKDLKNLKKLFLYQTKVSDKGLFFIKDLVKLEELDLSGTRVRGDGLHYLKNLKNLKKLSMSDIRLNSEEMIHLKDLKKLEFLYLDGTGIRDEGLSFLKYLRNVRVLDLLVTNVSSKGLKYLKNLKNLQELWLISTAVDDEGLFYLKDLRNLLYLNLEHTHVRGEGLKHLKNLKELRFLDLSVTGVKGTGFKYLKDLPNLKELGLVEVTLTKEGFDYLKQLNQLEKLALSIKVPPCSVNYERWKEDIEQNETALRNALPNCWIGG